MISIDFLDASDQIIHTLTAASVTDTAKWVLTELRNPISQGTRKIKYNFTATRYSGTNLDANLDSTFVHLYDAPLWTVVIRNDSGDIVRTIQGRGAFTCVEWDGKDEFGQLVANGAYTYELTVEQNGTLLFSTSGEISLDSTSFPTAIITSPTTGQEIFNLVEILGEFQDIEETQQYILEFGQGAAPTEWTELATGPVSFGPVALGSWETKPVKNTITFPNGAYTLRLTLLDFGGSEVQHSVGVNLLNLYLTDISRINSTIDVNNAETAQIEFSVSMPADVHLKIYPEKEGVQGQLVKVLTANYASAGSYSLSWDGTDSGGLFVEDEAYILVLEAQDPNNAARTDIYDPPRPVSTGWTSHSGDLIFNAYKNDFWNSVLNTTTSGRVSLTVTPTGASSFDAFSDVAYEAGNWPIFWDGRDNNGNFSTGTVQVVSLMTAALKPNYVITKGGSPTIGGWGSYNGVKSDPYRATISHGQFFKILYHLNSQSQVTVKILPPGINDPDAPEAIALLTDEIRQAGDHEVTWNALDPLDSTGNSIMIRDDGPHTFFIEVTNAQTSSTTLKRGVINMYQ